jgi:hypothetical protein
LKAESVKNAMPVLNVENPHFIVRLYENLLRIDLKEVLRMKWRKLLRINQFLKKRSAGY